MSNNLFSNPPNQATLQIPGSAPDQIPCCVLGMQGKRLSITSRDYIPTFSTVKIEYNDAMFLGEVVSCSQHANSTWSVDIKVEQILTGLQSLVNLRERLIGEGVPAHNPFRAIPEVGVKG